MLSLPEMSSWLPRLQCIGKKTLKFCLWAFSDFHLSSFLGFHFEIISLSYAQGNEWTYTDYKVMIPSKGLDVAVAVAVSDLSKAPGLRTHQYFDGDLAWKSRTNCAGRSAYVAPGKSNLRIACCLWMSTTDRLPGLAPLSTGEFRKCFSSWKWKWLACRMDLEKKALYAKKLSFIDPNWLLHKVSGNWISNHKMKTQKWKAQDLENTHTISINGDLVTGI